MNKILSLLYLHWVRINMSCCARRTRKTHIRSFIRNLRTSKYMLPNANIYLEILNAKANNNITKEKKKEISYLAFLFSSRWENPTFIHRKVKAANIIQDENLRNVLFLYFSNKSSLISYMKPILHNEVKNFFVFAFNVKIWIYMALY